MMGVSQGPLCAPDLAYLWRDISATVRTGQLDLVTLLPPTMHHIQPGGIYLDSMWHRGPCV